VLQSNVKFASLKEQALFYGDIPDDDPIDYHDVDVGQGSPEELADAIESFLTSAEQAGMSRDGIQSLRQLVTECKEIFRLKLGADPLVNVFCRPDQCSLTNSYVDNNSSLISQ
jgi:hypothetical protein